jgi:hypothetical protein
VQPGQQSMHCLKSKRRVPQHLNSSGSCPFDTPVVRAGFMQAERGAGSAASTPPSTHWQSHALTCMLQHSTVLHISSLTLACCAHSTVPKRMNSKYYRVPTRAPHKTAMPTIPPQAPHHWNHAWAHQRHDGPGSCEEGWDDNARLNASLQH